MEHIQQYTCVRFVDRSNQKDYVLIYNGNGCNSWLGRQGGGQYISLQQYGCLSQGTIVHELIHALGFGRQFHVVLSIFLTL
jgi:Notch-like protein